MESKRNAVIDLDFEKAANGYIDMLIAREKTEGRQSLESFDALSSKMRHNLEEGLYAFQRTYAHGYQVLIEELKQRKGEGALDAFRIKADCREVLEDPDTFVNFLSEGTPLCQLFGFSAEALLDFYDEASHILAEKRFEDAKDAFFFLTMVAPQVSSCWLALGFSYLQCREYEAALRACSQALDLNPENPDSYLIFSRVFLEMKEFDKALDVCELGLVHASENASEDWSEHLTMMMKEAQHQIKNIQHKNI